MNRIWVFLFCVVASAVGGSAWADEDGAFLDAPYRDIRPPRIGNSAAHLGRDVPNRAAAPRRSDTLSLIAKQTPVKAQGSRGTCSIFSATAMLESMMVIRGNATVSEADYSEEWLEYLITRTRQSDGSSSTANFNALVRFGTPDEASLPYIGDEWKSLDHTPLARSRCGHLSGGTRKSCLLAHRDPALLGLSDDRLLDSASGVLHDPEFQQARAQASEFREEHLGRVSSGWYVGGTNDVKALLAAGIPVTMDIDFYYGAWNHRKAAEYGIGRDLEQWDLGIVGYPERGSVDIEKSRENPAGHSVLLVGYDDDAVVTTEVLMQNGNRKRFTYRGVYYFKNSWGTASFGHSFEIDGEANAGYGAITQKYAHEYGGFYRFGL